MEKADAKPVKRLKDSLTFGNLWLYVLKIAKDEKEFYGYTLSNKIKDKFSFEPNKIILYTVLYKLEAEKLIESCYRERRKYYKITKNGIRVFKIGIEELKNKIMELELK